MTAKLLYENPAAEWIPAGAGCVLCTSESTIVDLTESDEWGDIFDNQN